MVNQLLNRFEGLEVESMHKERIKILSKNTITRGSASRQVGVRMGEEVKVEGD